MSLPKEKKDKLSDQVRDGIGREIKRQYDDLRKHEVSREDARDIVRAGYRKAADTPTPQD